MVHIIKDIRERYIGYDGSDLEGGYYDAGDNLKLLFPFAYSFTILAWSGLTFSGGYDKAGQMGYLRDGVRHAAWFMRKCHTEPGLLWAQVGSAG